MAGLVTVTFTNCTLTANVATIVVAGGGTYTLMANHALTLNGAFQFSMLQITTSTMSIDNTSQGVAINGSVAVEVDAPGGAPTITANNFSGSATVSWPTTSGEGYEPLSPGNAQTLSNFDNTSN